LKKNIIVKLIGSMLILISFAPLLQTKNFQLGLELIWFVLGMIWFYSGLIMKKNSAYRPLDRPLYVLHTFYLLGIFYIIFIKPKSWNKTFDLFDFKIDQIKLINISIVLSVASLISHFSSKRPKNTNKLPSH